MCKIENRSNSLWSFLFLCVVAKWGSLRCVHVPVMEAFPLVLDSFPCITCIPVVYGVCWVAKMGISNPGLVGILYKLLLYKTALFEVFVENISLLYYQTLHSFAFFIHLMKWFILVVNLRLQGGEE